MIKNFKIKIIAVTVIFGILPIFALAYYGSGEAEEDCPEASFKVIPEGMTQPGEEISLQAFTENFSTRTEDENKMHYNWCIDDVFLNTFYAGSSDEITLTPEGQPQIKNKYGAIKDNLSMPCSTKWEIGSYQTTNIEPGPEDEGLYVIDPNGYEKKYDVFSDLYYAPPALRLARIPNIDIDEDGLDDNWEIKYFKGRKISFNRNDVLGSDEEDDSDSEDIISFYMPSDRDKVLNLVTTLGIIIPEGNDLAGTLITDPDNDGWKWIYSDARYEQDSGYQKPEYATRLYVGRYSAPWMLGIPYATPFIRGGLGDPVPVNIDFDDSLDEDGRFADEVDRYVGILGNDTNIGEYFRGTDPLNSDTDSDGVNDVEDFYGRSQDMVTIKIQKDYNEDYDIDLFTFGANENYRNNDTTRDYLYANVHYPYLKGDEYVKKCNLDETPEEDGKIRVQPGLPLKVGWGVRPTPILTSDHSEPVVVTAETLKGDEMGGLNLDFQWSLEDDRGQMEPQDGDSGDGKQYFRFTPSKASCQNEVVGLEITEENGRMTYQELEVPVGIDPTLKATVIGSVDPENEKVVDFNQHIGAASLEGGYSGDAENFDFLLTGDDPFKDLINTEGSNQGFRKWDLVRLEARDIKEQYERGACTEKYGEFEETCNVNSDCITSGASCNNGLCMIGEEKTDKGINIFDVKWNVKRREQTMQSGKGMDYLSMLIILKGDPRKFSDSTGGEDEYSQIYNGTDWVNFELIDNENNIIAKKEMSFPIITPSINLLDINGVITDTSEEDSGEPKYFANPGDEITIKVGWRYFRPSQGFDVRWDRNGSIINESNASSTTTESTITFTAGYDSMGRRVESDEEIISVKVDSLVNVGDREETEMSDKSIIIELQDSAESSVDTALGGALNNLIPRYYRNIFSLFMISCIAGGVLLFVLSFTKKAGKNN